MYSYQFFRLLSTGSISRRPDRSLCSYYDTKWFTFASGAGGASLSYAENTRQGEDYGSTFNDQNRAGGSGGVWGGNRALQLYPGGPESDKSVLAKTGPARMALLDIYAGEKLVLRFIQIDKISTATATADGGQTRPYRFGYGYVDRNLNFKVDAGEKKVYFEFSDYSTNYIFYENYMG